MTEPVQLVIESDDFFMTVKDVAKFFAIKEYTVRIWIGEGRFGTCPKLNNQWRVLRSNVVNLAQTMYGETSE